MADNVLGEAQGFNTKFACVGHSFVNTEMRKLCVLAVAIEVGVKSDSFCA